MRATPSPRIVKVILWAYELLQNERVMYSYCSKLVDEHFCRFSVDPYVLWLW